MTFDVIESGSSGNAVVLNDTILLDCGVAYKKIEPYIKGLQLVFISHCHS